MNRIKFQLKFILYTFLFLSISNLVHSRDLDKYYDSKKISEYFLGILSLHDNDYASSYKHLKQLEGLEKQHSVYPQFYQYSLVNSGKINEAYRYSRKLENKKLDNFEGDLIMGVYYLKQKKYDKSFKYFQKLKTKNEEKETLRGLLSISLENWVAFSNLGKDKAFELNKNIPSRFKNIQNIQNTFIHCFFRSDTIIKNFEKLTFDKETDFSRYAFFHASYLNKQGKTNEAIRVIDRSLELTPRNLILSQFKEDINHKKNTSFSNDFHCENLSHISAELFYIVANALSSQSAYVLSNFYLNLAKYLNPNFISFDALYAENLYMIEKFEPAKKIYKKIINSSGSIYSWHASKQIANILREQDKEDESIKFLKDSYNKIDSSNTNKIYDYANFLKNNELFSESIKHYTRVLNLIEKESYLYPKATHGRGVAYERTDEWDKAEKDFLNSLSVSPDQAHVLNYLAYSWIEKGINVEKSLEMLKKANRLEKNDGYIIDSLGWALFKLKRYVEAEKYLRLALIFMPSDPIVNDHYGDVLWMNNKKISARYYWNYVSISEEAEKELKESTKRKLVFGL